MATPEPELVEEATPQYQVAASDQSAELLTIQEQMLRAGVHGYELQCTFQAVVSVLSQAVPCNCAALLSWSGARRNLQIEAAATEPNIELKRGRQVPISSGIEELANGHLQAVVCSDGQASASWLDRQLAQADIRSSITVRIGSQSPARKLLLVGSASRAAYSCRDVLKLQELAKAVHASLQNQWEGGSPRGTEPPAIEEGTVRERHRLVSGISRAVAHRLSNIFAVLLGNLQLLESNVEAAGIAQRLQAMQSNVMEGSEILHSLLELSTNKATHCHGVVDLGDLVEEVVMLTRPVWEGYRDSAKAVKVTHCSNDAVKVHAHRSELKEALLNLLFNAIHALPDGGEILVSEEYDDDIAFVEVRDNGVGMDAEVCRRATEPFFSTRGPSSQGLGLSLASDIARKHNGYVGIVSQPGEGSVVRLAIGLAEAG